MQNDKEEKKEQLDEFEKDLQEKLKILQECQNSNNLQSCFDCDKILECETRESYVKAVYLSMNKGVTGGFEF